MSRLHLSPVLPCFLFVLLVVTSLPAAERHPVPPPPGGGPGTHLAQPDINLPGTDTAPVGPFEEVARLPLRVPSPGAATDKALDTIGGDDVRIHTTDETLLDCSLDIAEDGTIYLASEQDLTGAGWSIIVYRSRDGGDSWEVWSTFSDPDPEVEYRHPSLVVAEGAADRCFLAYVYRGGEDQRHEVHVAWQDLSAPAGDFAADLAVMQAADRSFNFPCLAEDSDAFSVYYLYLVACRSGYDTTNIWFARSTDQGDSFESGYAIATVTGTDRAYTNPVVCYGFGGFVHVVWRFISLGHTFDSATRYRRASNYANGGLSAWDDIQYLTTTGDAVWEQDQHVAASLVSSQVLIAYTRCSPEYYLIPPAVMISSDGGENFGSPVVLEGIQAGTVEGLAYQLGGGGWVMATRLGQIGIHYATGADPATWSAAACFADSNYFSAYDHRDALALDPNHGYRAAVAWSSATGGGANNSLVFDAEWRADPGYPNIEYGFPVTLSSVPISSPAVVDLDGDGRLEIVFADTDHRIQVYRYNGAVQPGWPVDVGTELSTGPVAVGSLDGLQPVLVAGTADGRVFAYRPDGTPVPGWPFDTGTGQPAYVSIGAVGGPYPRTVVVCAGDHLHWVGEHGTPPPGTAYWTHLGGTACGPAAIGDVNGDGVSEAVAAYGGNVVALRMRPTGAVMDQDIDQEIAAAPSLADLDGDEDVEILVPTTDGLLVALQGDGTPLGGSWPFVSPSGYRLTDAAVADCLGSPAPEITVADVFDFRVHLLGSDGEEQAGYPVRNDGWYIFPAPIMGLVEGSAADVVVGCRGEKAWAWDDAGHLIHGWPRNVNGHIYQSPAMGDLDGDGRTEIVLLSREELVVVDVNQVPGTSWQTWGMARHDPQRTGCADCPEDLTTGVSDDGAATVTRVRFAPPTPSPGPGPQQFTFALPVRARVRLDVYDLRGALVRTLHREEMAPGWHTVGWDGRDGDGRPLASGQYLACLRVQGPGLDDVLTRKLVIMR